MKYTFKQAFLFLLFGGLLIIGLVGCSESDCPLQTRPMVRFNFYDVNNPTKAIAFKDSLSVITTNTVTTQGDSILINKETGASKVVVPLSYVNQETTYILKYSKTLSDTLWVSHVNTEHFISIECGMTVYSHIQSIKSTFHLIESVSVRNPEIDNNEKENIQIFYPSPSATN
ncbi:MAG: DUF6452 family protein [Bacteroidaceae bacterium]